MGVFLFAAQASAVEEDKVGLWFLKEEFIKLGKKEVYEKEKPARLQVVKEVVWGSKGLEKGLNKLWALESIEEPEFIYLYPMSGFAAVERLLQVEGKGSSKALLSCISYNFQSLLSLKQSFYKGKKESLSSSMMACSSLQFYGISADATEDFEQFFTQWLKEVSAEIPASAILMWRVLLGGDDPRYVIAFFAEDKQSLSQCSKRLDEAEEKIKEIIRGKRAVTCQVPTWLAKIAQ